MQMKKLAASIAAAGLVLGTGAVLASPAMAGENVAAGDRYATILTSWGKGVYDKQDKDYEVCDRKKDGYAVYIHFTDDPGQTVGGVYSDPNGSKAGCGTGGPVNTDKKYMVLCKSKSNEFPYCEWTFL